MNNGSKYCNSEWYEKICLSLDESGLEHEKVPIPEFPSTTIQENTTGASRELTLCEANIFYEDCIRIFTEINSEGFDKKKLLDFGTGWGRILRFFMHEFQVSNLIGVDISDELLSICRSTFPWGSFIKSEAYPPLALEDNSVDYIVGYSVFSHLSEKACMAWMEEFYRILRPGGVLALTTRGKWFLDYCESLQQSVTDSYSEALANLFDDFSEAKSRFDDGEFLHVNSPGVGGGGELNTSFYGETWIPEAYAKSTYATLFKVHPFDFSPKRSTHPIMVFEKES